MPKSSLPPKRDMPNIESDRERLGHRMYAGPSILDTIWAELDRIVEAIEELKAGEREGQELMGDDEVDETLLSFKGQATGLAYAIAVIQNPYTARLARDVAIDAVRKQAMAHYYGEE